MLAQIKHPLIGGSVNIIAIFPHLLFIASLHTARLISSFAIAPKMEALCAQIVERIQAGDKLKDIAKRFSVKTVYKVRDMVKSGKMSFSDKNRLQGQEQHEHWLRSRRPGHSLREIH